MGLVARYGRVLLMPLQRPAFFRCHHRNVFRNNCSWNYDRITDTNSGQTSAKIVAWSSTDPNVLSKCNKPSTASMPSNASWNACISSEVSESSSISFRPSTVFLEDAISFAVISEPSAIDSACSTTSFILSGVSPLKFLSFHGVSICLASFSGTIVPRIPRVGGTQIRKSAYFLTFQDARQRSLSKLKTLPGTNDLFG